MGRYKFIAGCPACGRKEKYQWVHKNCSSYEEIDEDGDIHCLGCNRNLGFLMDLEYNCGHHNYQQPTNALMVFQALGLLADVEDMPPGKAVAICNKVLERAKNRYGQ